MLPRRLDGLTPAFSKVSQHISRRMRCCGSIIPASRGEILKKPASNALTSPMEPDAKV
ncbi:hypothetical protein D3C76_1786070 [compost metagenome]